MTKRERKLADLQKRYAWFGDALSRAHAKGDIDSEAVRFLIAEARPLDPDAEPAYFGRAQAYSYIGEPPTRTVAGSIDVALQLLDRVANRVALVDALCADLSALHARELAAATP
jgi:hypothetical protein